LNSLLTNLLTSAWLEIKAVERITPAFGRGFVLGHTAGLMFDYGYGLSVYQEVVKESMPFIGPSAYMKTYPNTLVPSSLAG